MAEQEICHDCERMHDCKEVFLQMGGNGGPSIAVKVVIVFLLPILVFIISLVIFEEILAGVISNQRVQTVLSLLPALLVTFIFIIIVRMINKRFSQSR